MKIKLNKFKFLRNIIIGVVSLIIVALIVNYAPGYKRDKYKDRINLVIRDENVTENLKNYIYRDENNLIYMSREDIMELFDEDIYYDENYKTIIITSNTKVASMTLGENVIVINGSKVNTLGQIIEKDDTIYIPISEVQLVYNISIEYIEDSNIVIIDRLEEGMIVADLAENVTLKYKPRKISKNVVTEEKGEKVSCFYTTSKGWRLIRTADGNLRLCKSKYFSKWIYIKARHG